MPAGVGYGKKPRNYGYGHGGKKTKKATEKGGAKPHLKYPRKTGKSLQGYFGPEDSQQYWEYINNVNRK